MPSPVTDRRLKPVLDTVAAGQIKVLSVDVFDTLIWRRVPEAKDVFWLLGLALKAGGHLAPHVSPAQFAEIRPAAEKKARAIRERISGSREVTLEDVYALLPDALFVNGFDIPRRRQKEVELERGLMVADLEVAALLEHAKAKSVETWLVSDTYFSEDDMRGFLDAAFGGKPPPFGKLIVSNKEGRPKWRDLFDTLLARFNLIPGDVLHVGDNIDADVAPCSRLGMKYALYDKWIFSPRVQIQEFPAEGVARRALMGPLGDYGLTGLRSRLYHRAPADMPDEALPFWRYGACVLGPVFAAFGHWLMRECRLNKYAKVFGMMREGRFLNRLVTETAKLCGDEIATEELWLSRRAVIRASLFPDDLRHLTSFISYCPGKTTDEILGQCGLARADLAGMLPPGSTFDLLDSDDLTKLCIYIGKNDAVKAKVLAVSAASRKNLILALSRQIDLNGDAPLVLMDLGYAATIQVVLAHILQRSGYRVPVIGLYLALNDAATQNLLGSIDTAGADLRAYLSQDGFEPKASRILSAVPYVIEHATMCREGSLFEFDPKGDPILLENLREPAQLAQMEILQEGVMAFVRAAQRHLGPGLGEALCADDAIKRQMESIIVASTLYPSREEIAALGRWRHEAKYDMNDLRRFFDLAVDGGDLEYKGLPMLNDVTGSVSYWPSAGLASISTFMSDFYAAGYFSPFKAAHFTSGPLLGQFAICPDRGQGFDDKVQGATTLSINAFGAGEIDVTIKPLGGDAFQRLRLRWPQSNAVLKINSLELNYVGEGQTKKVEMTGPEMAGAWSLTGMAQLEPSVYRLHAEGPQAVLDISAATPPWPHVLKLRMRYKYLKLDNIFGNRPNAS